MKDVAIIGGGPAGLSAALFTAKNGLDTVVFDTDKTWLHKAHLFNYLGIDSMDGSAFMEQSRAQVEEFGVERHPEEKVEQIERESDEFRLWTVDDEYAAAYVVFATGANRDLATELGFATTDEGTVDVGIDMETSIENAYAVGAVVRAETWQAIIAAGDGGAAALDILSKEKGEKFHDFDTPADAE